MAKRKIIRIDENKCNGCGLCIPNCPEGALKIIDGKVRLISDLFCDGLGACIGHCPQGAITIEEREAELYDERKVMANIIKQGPNVIKEHLDHLRSHNEHGYLKEALAFLEEKGIEVPAGKSTHGRHVGCPGSKIIDMRKDGYRGASVCVKLESQLSNWPVQIKLVPANAPYLRRAHLLIAADCVPFAYADFHEVLLKGKALLVGCPKLDDISCYAEKISAILRENYILSVTYAHMEVPCCSGLISVIEEAIAASGRNIPFKDVTISIRGEKK
ncbi:MAG: 4Fe-4S binding protein [Candidatus Omnitrophica bacterium]|nr:4Fe-4S binding protein [Candidatus Omnitrophota bacterium]MCM8790923.1 4Fe-4S binding protein [Candidatus Omnitrophota bacterium]